MNFGCHFVSHIKFYLFKIFLRNNKLCAKQGLVDLIIYLANFKHALAAYIINYPFCA